MMDRAWRRLMNHRRWSFNDVTSTVTLPLGVQTFNFSALPFAVKHFDGLRLSGQNDPLFLPYPKFREYIGTGVATGVPEVYSRRADTLILYPTPSAAQVAYVDYNKNPTKPSAVVSPSATDLGIPDTLEEALTEGVIYLLARRERDDEGAASANAAYDRIIAEFMASDGLEQRQNSQRVTASGVHEAYTTTPIELG